MAVTACVLELPARLGGPMEVHTLVSDFTGTISVDGALVPGVAERIERLAGMIDISYMTADTHGKAQEALAGLPAQIVKVVIGVVRLDVGPPHPVLRL